MELEDLLRHSLLQYRQLLDELAEIGRMLKNGRTEAIGAPLKSWLQLQGEAQRTDARIVELREQNPAAVRGSQLFEARQLLMKELAVQCRHVFSRANTHKAMIRDELLRLRDGRAAISGYRPARAETGNRIGSRH
jgi:hypothetical protein